MLKLTKRTDYGMMAMHYLVEHAEDGKPHSARDIAEAYKIPLPILAKILHALARAELIASQQGSMGGYVLARPAKTISALEVIAAIDTSPVITSCTTAHGTCEMVRHCIVKEPLQRVNDRIRSVLESISIAELVEPTENTRNSDEFVKIAY